MDDFYVTLPSSVRNPQFENTSSRYVTRLPEVLQLEKDKYSVAVTDIIYPYSFVNVGRPLNYWIHFKEGKPPLHVELPPNQYSNLSHVIDTLNGKKTTRMKRSAVVASLELMDLKRKRAASDGNVESYEETMERLKKESVELERKQKEIDEYESLKRAKEAEDARKQKEIDEYESLKRAKEAEDARKQKEIDEYENLKRAKEAEDARKQKEIDEYENLKRAKEGEDARKQKEIDEYENLKRAKEEAEKAAQVEKKADEAKRKTEAEIKKAEDAKKVEEAKKTEEAKKKAAEESKKKEAEVKKAEDSRKQKEIDEYENLKRVKEEAEKVAQVEKKADEESKKKEAEVKKAEEAKKKEAEAKKAEEAKKKEAEVKKAEEAKKKEAEAKKAEEAKKKEAEVKKAEEAKKKEAEAKNAEEAKKKEAEVKKAEEAKKKEAEVKKAEEAKKKEAEVKKAEEAKKAKEEIKKLQELDAKRAKEAEPDAIQKAGVVEVNVAEEYEKLKAEKEGHDSSEESIQTMFDILQKSRDAEIMKEVENIYTLKKTQPDAMENYKKSLQRVFDRSRDKNIYQNAKEGLKSARAQLSIETMVNVTSHLTFAEVDGKVHVNMSEEVLFVEFEESCAYFLGFQDTIVRESKTASSKIDYFGNVSTIYLYCDIVDPIIVGDQKNSLLAVIPCKGNFGEMIHHTIPYPRYLPIMNGTIDTISVQLLSEFAEPIQFNWGSTIIVLHLKKM